MDVRDAKRVNRQQNRLAATARRSMGRIRVLGDRDAGLELGCAPLGRFMLCMSRDLSEPTKGSHQP